MSVLTTASVTSMNYVGFEDAPKNGLSPLIFNQIYIAPTLPVTAGKWIHPVAGFVPGQQPYLKIRRSVWNKSKLAEKLRMQGFKRMNL